ncbi:MAG: type I-E CRISPR-associated protein Cas5/CasD [Gammaproteobacteria bacterium]|jgi:CRISPR system Cascade subunit CasD|nr:type I-E CRISPR-associated protein Cas5/CasD [Gammaproteobacteria bacterium]
MDFLIFQLQATFSSWGDTAVGEFRPSANYPSISGLLGLLAAALGLERENEAAHLSLSKGYVFAMGVQSSGRLLRDYHTVQVPGRTSIKGRPLNTRMDELNIPKDELNTILTTRDYRQDASCLIAVQTNRNGEYSLLELVEALMHPKFTLYVGRKSCPLSAPLFPCVINAGNAYDAFKHYYQQLEAKLGRKLEPLERIVWCEGIDSGCDWDLEVTRKDRLLSRKHWQFGDRTEYIKLLGGN